MSDAISSLEEDYVETLQALLKGLSVIFILDYLDSQFFFQRLHARTDVGCLSQKILAAAQASEDMSRSPQVPASCHDREGRRLRVSDGISHILSR